MESFLIPCVTDLTLEEDITIVWKTLKDASV